MRLRQLFPVCMIIGVLLFPLRAKASAQEGWHPPVHDNQVHLFLLTELLEYGRSDSEDSLRWDILGWVGGDYNRLWVKTEGSHDASGGASGEADAELLYGRLVSPYWDFQIGVREEWRYGRGRDRSRTSAVLGFQGLAPYWFDLEPSLFISEKGDVSARLTVDYDLLLTQRLVLQPRLETLVAIQKVDEFGVGRGINNIDLGLRLRYEITRKFAPYIGFSWKREMGETATLARREGMDVEERSFVAGLRLWF
jgi:copper resistance protein B